MALLYSNSYFSIIFLVCLRLIAITFTEISIDDVKWQCNNSMSWFFSMWQCDNSELLQCHSEFEIDNVITQSYRVVTLEKNENSELVHCHFLFTPFKFIFDSNPVHRRFLQSLGCQKCKKKQNLFFRVIVLSFWGLHFS